MFRKTLHHFIQKIADPGPVRSGDRNRITDAQVVKFIDTGLILYKVINLVDHQDHALMTSSEHVRHFGVGIHEALLQICQKEDHIRRIDCNLRLLPHLGKNHIVGVRFDSAGINQGKLSVKPFHIRIDPVPGHARRVLNDGDPGTGQGIKQRRFSYIRSAYDRDNRFAHTDTSFFSNPVRLP